MKLKGKVAVVTGAASGIGKAIAVLFAGEGASVVVSDINFEGAKQTASEITANGGTAVPVSTNVAREDDVQKMIDAAVTNYGTLDILVNNAGVMDDFSPVGEMTDATWDRIFAINAGGPMRAMRKAIGVFLAKGGGTIVNIASVGGLFGCRAGAAYTASKHAVVGLTKNVAYQYAEKGIRCNAIAPGAVETNIGASIGNPNQFGMSRAMKGMGLNPRLGKPEEIAAAALFLAAGDSSIINGTVLVADTGWTAY
jgi:NAD(P)-dependent dehydrogenase (short-subunit alcohol dehydrogenase family)